MRTIPSMCLVCGEIVDVAVPLGETGPGRCPMCGGELTCDFDLPVNEHVRVEVQTPERLRFSFPYTIGDMGLFDQLAWLLISLTPLIGIYDAVFEHLHNPLFFGLVRCVSLVAILLMISAILLFLLVLMLRGRITIDVDTKRLAVIMSVLAYCRNQTVRLNGIGRLYSQSRHSVIQELNNYSKKRIKLWGRTKPDRYLLITNGPNADLARYVTHLIRRQLLTMGHTLQDG